VKELRSVRVEARLRNNRTANQRSEGVGLDHDRKVTRRCKCGSSLGLDWAISVKEKISERHSAQCEKQDARILEFRRDRRDV